MERVYNRKDVLDYAHKWAYGRNPKYYNYDKLGGDCTNFISQCIFAGSKVMNYTKTFGWYYNNANDKAPAWTGVEYLHNFLIREKGVGPIGKKASKKEMEIGDIIQLAFSGNNFIHSLLVTKKEGMEIFVSTHTVDNLDRRLDLYNYENIRFIHIEKVIL